MAGELGTSNYEDQVRATRAKFVARVESSLDGILIAMTETTTSGSRESQSRKVHRLLHDMAGNAAMLDLNALDQKLRQGVEIAEVADAQNRPITAEETAAIRVVVEDARMIAQALSERA